MSKLNIQQLVKDRDFLRCFRAADGHKLVYTDIASLEPHVLAHFSRDRGLMALYGPDVQASDVYLFVGANIGKYRDKIREYFDPANPTAESIAAAKKHAKAERTAVKPIYLGWIYGLGAQTMHVQTQIPVEECKAILAEVDEAFPNVGRFYKKLRNEWEHNGGHAEVEWVYDSKFQRNLPILVDGEPGWVYNGRGRPIGVAPEKIKDVGNRFVQSTGHDVLMQLLSHIDAGRRDTLTSMRPYNVDIHDATIWEVPEGEVDRAKRVIEEAYVRLNETLQWSVQIRGDVTIGDNLGDFLE